MNTIEKISHEICDKYNLTIDLSVPIENAIKEAQSWIPIEEKTEIPFNEWILIKNDYKPATTYLRGELDLKFVKASFNFWRPIELK